MNTLQLFLRTAFPLSLALQLNSISEFGSRLLCTVVQVVHCTRHLAGGESTEIWSVLGLLSHVPGCIHLEEGVPFTNFHRGIYVLVAALI